MNVLIVDYNLYSSLGGGQTFYRTLIESHPHIKFYFLSTAGAVKGRLPENARSIPLRNFYSSPNHRVHSQTGRVLDRVTEALNIAASVRDLEFDIVDYPDYYQCGAFLRPAFEFHGIKGKKYALSMHGVISTSLLRNWNGDRFSKGDMQTTLMLEKLQYESFDIRYAISERYADEWKAQTGVRAEIYDPIRVLQGLTKRPGFERKSDAQPKLVFIGRTEKRKGPDLAIDLVSLLPIELKSPLYIIGPESESLDGLSSESFLSVHAANRNVDVVFLGKRQGDELEQMLKDPYIVLLPSRYDTFNLVALESLLQGCPTVIGNGAGVCDYLDKRFPSIPYLKLDTSNPFRNSSILSGLIAGFSEYQERLRAAIETSDFSPSGPDIDELYRTESKAVTASKELADSQFQDSLRVLQFNEPRRKPKILKSAIVSLVKPLYRMSLLKRLRAIVIAYRHGQIMPKIKAATIRMISAAGYYDRFLEIYYLLKAFKLRSILQIVSSTGLIDHATGELNRAVEAGRSVAYQRFARAKVFHAAAYGEERIGSFAVAAAYGLRVLRWIPNFPPRLVADVKRWLGYSGFHEESKSVDLMFANEDPSAIQKYLEGRRLKLLNLEKPKFEILERHSVPGLAPKVSIIVSMYNAADKLDRFLDLIANQTLLKSNQAELILVDSGSRRDEIDKIREAIKDCSFPWIYARTPERETIQLAWNRGIYLSSALNVCFLGVDETLTPEALEILQAALERNPDVDWVMSDSIVTEVTPDGEWLRDVMTYNREGFRLSKHILECCYLSYVGGLYRKNIHERVGYYDPTFRAAGDTEFKNRAMPFIRAQHIPLPLGIFLNYPEERTTQHPRAEIEDLRAWYLFRTEGGLRYLTARMTDEELVELFRDCLGYRKSYCGHISYDLELAAVLEPIIRSRVSGFEIEALTQKVRESRNAIQNLEWNCESRLTLLSGFVRARTALNDLSQSCKKIVPPETRSAFGIFHDNRFEQHSNVW